jgi:hypothetical protein
MAKSPCRIQDISPRYSRAHIEGFRKIHPMLPRGLCQSLPTKDSGLTLANGAAVSAASVFHGRAMKSPRKPCYENTSMKACYCAPNDLHFRAKNLRQSAPQRFQAGRRRLACDAGSAQGQSRRFGHRPATSGLPRSTDIVRSPRYVRVVPITEVAQLMWPKQKAARRRLFNSD